MQRFRHLRPINNLKDIGGDDSGIGAVYCDADGALIEPFHMDEPWTIVLRGASRLSSYGSHHGSILSTVRFVDDTIEWSVTNKDVGASHIDILHVAFDSPYIASPSLTEEFWHTLVLRHVGKEPHISGEAAEVEEMLNSRPSLIAVAVVNSNLLFSPNDSDSGILLLRRGSQPVAVEFRSLLELHCSQWCFSSPLHSTNSVGSVNIAPCAPEYAELDSLNQWWELRMATESGAVLRLVYKSALIKLGR